MGPTRKIKSHFVNEFHRALVFEICHGPDYAHQLEPLMVFICSHTRTIPVCKWLLKNNLTGKELLDFWLDNHKGSVLAVVAYLNQQLEKADEIRNVFAGRDIQ